MEFALVILGIVFGVVVGVAFCLLYLNRRQIPEAAPVMVNVGEMTELIETISDGYVKGIRSVLGLDLGGEIVGSEDQEDETTLAVRMLEMDPFMGEGDEWLTIPNNGNEEP